MNRFGFVRVTCASIRTSVANPEANAAEVVRVLDQVADSDVVLVSRALRHGLHLRRPVRPDGLARRAAFGRFARSPGPRRADGSLSSSGCRCRWATACYNGAVVISDGKVLGVVPKQFIPNYKEFYESRWFRPADGSEPSEIEFPGGRVPFGIDLLFACEGRRAFPSWWGSRSARISGCRSHPARCRRAPGATILLNLSASNETIGKSQYRTDLVVGQSGRCIAAYAYAGAGPSESTTDLVFGGHCLIAENGRLLAESPRVGDGQPIRRDTYWITQDVDVAKLAVGPADLDELRARAAVLATVPARRLRARPEMPGLKRFVPGTPFVPAEGPELHRRCAEIFGIQCAGLAKRIEQLPPDTSAEHRRLGRTRLDPRPAGRRQDVRPAQARPRARSTA